MNFWLIHQISLTHEGLQKACAIQILQTAMSLADQGHRVLLWVQRCSRRSVQEIENHFGRKVPATLMLMKARTSGASLHKQSPFATKLLAARNVMRAVMRGFLPDVIVSRSPEVLAHCRKNLVLPVRPLRILELQYPESVAQWRKWRSSHPDAGLGDGVRALRELRQRESECVSGVDGILYAALGHVPLMESWGYSGPSRWFPSACPKLTAPQKVECLYDVGYVGTLAPENGLECLLEALALMPNRRLAVAGSGAESYEDSLRALARQLGVVNRVIWLGRRPFCETIAIMRQCRTGAVPVSRRQGAEKRQYASPLKLIEWMSAGVPMVCSRVPSIAQHVQHNASGLLVRADSPRELAAALTRLLEDEALHDRLAISGVEMAGDNTTLRRAGRLVAFAEELRSPPQLADVSRSSIAARART